MTNKRKTVENKVDKKYDAGTAANFFALNSIYKFVVNKKFARIKESKTIFEWGCIFIGDKIIDNIPPPIHSLLSKQQVEDLSDLLK